MDQNQNVTADERFETLRAAAKEIGCDLSVTLTIGGVRLDELYRIFEAADENPETLAGHLDTIERMVADARVIAAADATKRLLRAEEIEKLVRAMVDARSAEYRVALDSLHAGFKRGSRPEDNDITSTMIDGLVAMERGRPLGEALADLLGKTEPTVETPE